MAAKPAMPHTVTTVSQVSSSSREETPPSTPLHQLLPHSLSVLKTALMVILPTQQPQNVTNVHQPAQPVIQSIPAMSVHSVFSYTRADVILPLSAHNKHLQTPHSNNVSNVMPDVLLALISFPVPPVSLVSPSTPNNSVSRFAPSEPIR
jgi:hypothetical protein